MPIRIFEIAKQTGLESLTVLAKAKELGISAARVPSSSLDRITAEFLMEKLGCDPILVESVSEPSPQSTANVAIATPPVGRVSSAPTALGANSASRIVITATGPELYRLAERILKGEVEFTCEISSNEGSPPLKLSLAHDSGVRARAPRAEVDDRMKNILRGAYYAAKPADDDWVNLADYGNALRRLQPTFQAEDFGERSLGALVRRVGDVFEVRNDEHKPLVFYVRLKQPGASAPEPKPVLPVSIPIIGEPVLARGKIHNVKLGYGFVAPDDGGENIFFHASDVVGGTVFELQAGDPVEYEPSTNEKGPCAKRVRKLI